MMTIQSTKRLCWAAAAAMAAAAIAAMAMAVTLSYDLGTTASDGAASVKQAGVAKPTSRPTLADYEPFLDDGLRRPLPKAAPPPPLPEPIAPPPPTSSADAGLNLLGTVTEASNSYAIFQTADGLQFKHVGETIAGVTVIDITEGVVNVRRSSGESVTFRVPLPPGAP